MTTYMRVSLLRTGTFEDTRLRVYACMRVFMHACAFAFVCECKYPIPAEKRVRIYADMCVLVPVTASAGTACVSRLAILC